MTIGTAMVASTKVRRTGVSARSQSPKARLRASNVGNTASQIIRASWCLVGGPAAADVELGVGFGGGGVVMPTPANGRAGCEGESVVEVPDCVADVFLDQVGVDADGGRGAGASGGDHLGARVDDVPGGPDAWNAGAPGGVDGDPAVAVDVAAQGDEQ